MMEEGYLVGITEESYKVLVEKFIDYTCDKE
jgi:hypothetical protein